MEDPDADGSRRATHKLENSVCRHGRASASGTGFNTPARGPEDGPGILVGCARKTGTSNEPN